MHRLPLNRHVCAVGLCVVIIAALVSACAPVAPMQPVAAQSESDPVDMDEIAAQVQAFWDEYARTNVAGDIEGWINLWDEAGVKMIYGHPPIVGRDAVLALKQAASEKLDVTSMSITNQDVELSGDLATVRGIYEGVKTPKDGSAPQIIDGWYSSVLKRDADGNWKLLWDTCASNVPPAVATEPDMDVVAAEVQAFWDEYAAANMAGDAERWIALWEEDGIKMSPGKMPIEGKETIFAGKKAGFEHVVINDMAIDNLEVEIAGDWAFVRGLYSVTVTPIASEVSMHDEGTYMSILKRQPDGSWKLYRDIMNTNLPPAVAQSETEPTNMEEVAAQVQAFWDEYAAANMAGDAERWIALWEEDGIKMGPGGMPVEGKETIFAKKQGSLEKKIVNEQVINNLEVEVAGDWAFVRGVYTAQSTPVGGGESAYTDGKYMSILKHQPDGSWKLYRDIYNTNLPPATPDVEAVTAAIEEAFTEYGASLGDADIERWAALWTEDGVQQPPGAPPRFGRDTIHAAVGGAMEQLAFEDMQIDVQEVLVEGDLAIARGLYTTTYVPHDGSPPIPVDGKYTTTFQKQADGSWKIYRDIFNSNVPPAGPPETDIEAVTAEIEAIFAEYAGSLIDGDADRWAALWTEDGVQSPPGFPINEGLDVIGGGITAELEELVYEDMTIDVEEVLAFGDYAIARGLFSATIAPIGGGDSMFVDGKYTTTFQKQADGSWKIFRDIYNMNE